MKAIVTALCIGSQEVMSGILVMTAPNRPIQISLPLHQDAYVRLSWPCPRQINAVLEVVDVDIFEKAHRCQVCLREKTLVVLLTIVADPWLKHCQDIFI